MSELRRNPFTRKWVIYTNDALDVGVLHERKAFFRENTCLFPHETEQCPYCAPSLEKRVQILAMKDERITYARDKKPMEPWDVKVIAASKPIFRIEDSLNRRGKRLYDIMGSPGAHEEIIMTPKHNAAIWDLTPRQLEQSLVVLKERMRDLLRDERLGHQFAYHTYGQTICGTHNHAVINLLATPFVPEKIQRELSGTFEWYKMKERCLFCDIFEEELTKRERGERHGIIEETTHFTAFIPYFASYPFEIWIQPIDHYSDILDIPDTLTENLAYILYLVFQRLHKALGVISLLVTFMNQPNIRWGINRGYWKTLKDDWHTSIRIIPDTCIENDTSRDFFMATGSLVNPLRPEIASEFLRSLST